MSTIQDGTLLSTLQHQTGTHTVQPSSNPAKSEEILENSQIQPAKTAPQIVVSKEDAFDQYESTFVQEELSSDPNAIANMDTETAKKGEKSLEEPDFYDYQQKNTSLYSVSDVEIYDNVAGYQPVNVAEPNVPKDMKMTVEDKVKEATSYGFDSPAPTTAEVLTKGNFSKMVAKQQELKDYQAELPSKLEPTTPLQKYQAHPIHTQNSIEVMQTLEDLGPTILRPDTEEPMWTPPERPLVPEQSNVESTHQPTFAKDTPVEAKAEENFQKGVMEKLQVQAKEKSAQLGEPAATIPTSSEASAVVETQASQVSPAPQAVVAQSADTAQDRVEPAITQPTPVTATPDPSLQKQPEVEFTQTETADSALLQDSNQAAQVEATTPQRVETQSTAEVYAQEATQNVNYEPIELPQPEYQPPEPVESQVEAPAVAEAPQFEPQLVEAKGIDPEILAEILPDTSEVAREEYVPPVFTQSEVAENPLLTEEKYFPPLPGRGEPTISEEAVAEMIANDYEIPDEMKEISTSEYEIPENETEVTTMTQEQLAYLRNNDSAVQYTPAVSEISVNHVDSSDYDLQAVDIVEESWIPAALNMETNIRFATTIGEAEVDVSRFEDNYVLPELSSLEDYDYNLVANRVVESAMSNTPKELIDVFT